MNTQVDLRVQLFCYAECMAKIIIIGCSGSGKTTLAYKLGSKYNIRPIDLDNLYFEDGFTSEKRPLEDFMKDVTTIAEQDNWIAEGMFYKHDIEEVLWRRADTVIWLNLPLWQTRARAWKRSLSRLIKRPRTPSGKPISRKHDFGKYGVLRALKYIHAATRKNYPSLLEKIENDTQVIIIKNNADYKKLLGDM